MHPFVAKVGIILSFLTKWMTVDISIHIYTHACGRKSVEIADLLLPFIGRNHVYGEYI